MPLSKGSALTVAQRFLRAPPPSPLYFLPPVNSLIPGPCSILGLLLLHQPSRSLRRANWRMKLSVKQQFINAGLECSHRAGIPPRRERLEHQHPGAQERRNLTLYHHHHTKTCLTFRLQCSNAAVCILLCLDGWGRLWALRQMLVLVYLVYLDGWIA